MMKKYNVKYAVAAAAVMAAIIAARMILSCVFTSHVGEVFSRIAVSALFYYSIFRLGQKCRQAAC